MTKLTLTDIENLENESTVVSAINANNALIENALEITLSRDGTAPNTMVATLDMNSNRIINLPEPINNTEPLRLVDTDIATLGQMEEYKDAAIAAKEAAELAEAAAEEAQAGAEAAETGAEEAQTAAENAQAAAEAAQSAAEDAQTAAELAETNAESAQTAAEAAQAAAETAESNAATSETNAATSETNASNSEAAALAAQAAAEAAQASAESAADNFDDVYLGSKASDPTVDNDGNALIEGQLYWNATSNNLRIYDGAAWQAYSATAGITDLVDDTSPQLGGDLDLNGHVITGMVIGTNVQAYDADTLKADTADILTAGFATTPYNAGTKSSGTFTPDEANGNLQYATNGGAHTLTPPTNNCTIIIQYTNNSSAGTITTSGFTKKTGSVVSTVSGDDFMFYITKLNGFSHLHVQALQ